MPEETLLKNRIAKDQDSLGQIEKFKEFLPLFRRVLNAVEQLERRFSDAERQLNSIANEIKGNTDSTLTSLKKQTSEGFMGDEFKRLQSDIKAMETRLDKKIESVKDGKPGRDGLPGVHGKTPTEEEIRKALQPFKEELEKKIEEKIKKVPTGRTPLVGRFGGGRKVPIFQATDFTSSVDGATTTFRLPRDTVRVFGVFSTQFPGVFNTSDWSFTGNTLTLNFTLQSGQSLVVFYETLFYA